MHDSPLTTVPPQAAQTPLSAIVLSFAAVAFLCYYIAKTLTAPLSALPGTALSKWTTLPIRIVSALGYRHTYVHALHTHYGPVIRLSPREVSVTGAPAVKQLYKIGAGFLKTSFYDDFTNNQPILSMFAIADDAAHGVRRRLVAHQFTERAIRELEPEVVARNTRLAVEGMEREMKGQGFVDVFKWFVFMANDVICEASFAENFGLLAEGKSTEYITDVVEITKGSTVRVHLPIVHRIWTFLFPSKIANSVRIARRLAGYSSVSLDRYERHLKENPDNAKPSLISRMFAAIESGAISREEVRREGTGYIVAGTDTTANAATYAVWLLSSHPAYERRVCEEVATLPEDFTDEQLRRLPALCNAITETLRLRSPVGQSLPRAVPPEGVRIGEFSIPGGVEVGAPAWTLHRDPTVWTSPDDFVPERWNNATKEMRELYLPFGGGNRTCIGLHLAQSELRHALANFYRTFSSGVKPSPAHGFSKEDMTPLSYFIVSPKGKRCLVERK